MTSILLILLLSVIRAQHMSPVPSCPASCLVCSEEAVICNKLANIIDAPDTTQALLLTEGSISAVQPASLSDLSNITVIVLSHNQISVLSEQSFRTLPFLHTLLLDHNLLTSQALQGGALTNLTQLEVLALGHNLISMIRGGWLKGSRALRSLKLEGNLLTSLDSDSFSLNDLKHLESLDLSDNLIDHLDRNSFSGLMSLQSVDLSRNHLSSAPAEAFSYLNWLTNLNLDRNLWNCSCQLLELAAFLSTFMQQPDKTIYNGRKMVCVSTDNPAVTTVLELTEANCVPSNQNITVQIETRGSVMPQLYARDLAITAVTCFIGGICLTLLVVLIIYQVSLRKKLNEGKIQKEEEEGCSTMENHHHNHIDISDKRKDLFLQANGSQSCEKDFMTLDVRTDGHGRQLRSRADENGIHFWCVDCRTKGQRGMGPNPMRWNNRINGGMDAEGEIGKRGARMMTEEERKRPGTQQEFVGRDFPNKLLSHGNNNSFSHPQKETISQRPETLAAYGKIEESYRSDLEVQSNRRETLHCESCHRTYRVQEQKMRHGGINTNMKDSAQFDGLPPQFRQVDRGKYVNHNQFDMVRNADLRRETRNVTFDLESLRTLEKGKDQGKEKREEEETTSRDKETERMRTHKAKVQSSRSLKVKLNLNPLRKSKVHPKRKTEQGYSEKSSSKKSIDKRQDGKERGERRGKGKSVRKTKGSRDKMRKSTKTKRSTEESEEENVEDGKEESQESTRNSKKGKGGKKGTEGDESETKHPENSGLSNTTNTAGHSASAIATEQRQNLQGGPIQYQGAGLVLESAKLSLQPPNLSLHGFAGSQLIGSSLNTMARESNALFPSYSGNSVSPSIALIGPNMAPSGAPDSLSRQAGMGLFSPSTSTLASSGHAIPSNLIHTTALHTSQHPGLASSLTANPAVNLAPGQLLQSKKPPYNPPLIARLQSDPTQGPGPQGVLQLPPKFQTPQNKDSLSLPSEASPNADGFNGVAPQAPIPETTVENLTNSNNHTETVHVPAGSTVTVSAGVVAPTEGLKAGVSGDSMQAADVSVSGVSAPSMSIQSVSSAGDAVASAALLQQECLSEHEGSSPRRKLRLVLPEKTSSRPPTALERKIR